MRAPLDVKSAWIGFGLSGLFFYPLASALSGDPYYLQWQPSHGSSALAALMLLAVAVAVVLRPVLMRGSRAATVTLALVALLPLVSLGAGVSRQLPFGETLRRLWELPIARYGLVAVAAGALIAALVVWPLVIRRGLERLLQILTPIAVVVTIGLARSMFEPATPIATRASSPVPDGSLCPSVVALLFDEFSFSYLYEGSEIRPEFPNLRRFGAQAIHYQAVRSPGPETINSLPGYLAGRTYDAVVADRRSLLALQQGQYSVLDVTRPEALLPTARRTGLSPDVIGYYIAYCSLVGATADSCRSFSLYNRATLRSSGSMLEALIDPVLTTVILWPRQFPLGILKGWAFGRHQRAMLDATLHELAQPREPGAATFQFVHFSVPHLPFVFTERGFEPTWDPFRQSPDSAYVRQLHHADRVFGEIVDRMTREGRFADTTVAFLSDHGFRGGGKETDVRRVPFLVKRAGQTERRDVTTPIAGEQLLRNLVASCNRTEF